MVLGTNHVARKHPGRLESPDRLRPPPALAAMRLRKIVAFSHVQLGCATSCPTLGRRLIGIFWAVRILPRYVTGAIVRKVPRASNRHQRPTEKRAGEAW